MRSRSSFIKFVTIFRIVIVGASKLRSWVGPNSLITGSSPSPRDGFGFACVESDVDGHSTVYAFGGLGLGFPNGLGDLYRLDTISLSWTALTGFVQGTPPPTRYNIQMLNMGGQLYFFGGVGPGGASDFTSDVYRFDPTSLIWDRLRPKPGAAPAARHNYGGAALGGCLFIFSGRGTPAVPLTTLNGRFSDTWKLDLTRMEWTPLNNSQVVPQGRAAASLTAVGDSLLLFGGRGETATLAELHRLDPISGQWSIVNDSGIRPSPRYGHLATYLDGSMYLFSGQPDFTIFSSELFRLDVSTMTWYLIQQAGALPSGRSFAGFSACGGRIYMLGGFFIAGSRNTFLWDLHMLELRRNASVSSDPASNSSAIAKARIAGTWSDLSGPLQGSTPSPRYGHGTAAAAAWEGAAGVGSGEENLYVFGGLIAAGANRQCFNDLHRLDPRRLTWTNLSEPLAAADGGLGSRGPSPSARAFMGFSALGPRLYVLGGINATGHALSDFFAYDIASDAWHELPSLASGNDSAPSARSAMGMVGLDGALFVFGGQVKEGLQLSDLFRFDVSSSSWQALAVIGSPSPRAYFGCIEALGAVFIFGGIDFIGNRLDELWRFDPLTARWEQLAGLAMAAFLPLGPSGRSSPGIATWQGSIYIFGGMEMAGVCGPPKDFSYIYSADLWRFNLALRDWSQLTSTIIPPRPVGRCGGGLASVAGKLVIFGGMASSEQADLWAIQPPTTLQMPPRADAGFFLVAYDWDKVAVLPSVAGLALPRRLELCLGVFPCSLSLDGGIGGPALAELLSSEGAGVSCSARVGCSSVQLANLVFRCDPLARGTTSLLSADGAVRISLRNVSFIGCNTAADGGALSAGGGTEVKIADCLFEATTALGSGGAIAVTSSSLNISRTIFRRCQADSSPGNGEGGFGGALSTVASALSVRDCEFAACRAGQGGGALAVNGGSAAVVGCRFSATQAGGDGGAIMGIGGATVDLQRSTFNSTISNSLGGAVRMAGGLLRVVHCGFRDATAGDGGGAVFAGASGCFRFSQAHSALAINESIFEDCMSGGAGGAVMVTSAAVSASVKGSTFARCRSQSSGGAVSATDAAWLDLSNTSFAGNIAAESGGAVCVDAAAEAVVLSSRFEGNRAGQCGGALAVISGAHAQVNDSSFITNSAAGVGGGALCSMLGLLQLSKLSCQSNTALAGGGGALFWHGDPWLANSSLIGASIPTVSTIMCGPGNAALYGQCLASSCRSLLVEGMPSTASTLAHAGQAFAVRVLKKDAYNQTVATDSRTFLAVQTARREAPDEADLATTLAAQTLAQFQRGEARFSMIVKPSFTVAPPTACAGGGGGGGVSAARLIPPLVYFHGTDMETLQAVRSPLWEVALADGHQACPLGYVLSLDAPDYPGSPRSGSCVECAAGTYSVDPLAGAAPDQPTCLNCPAGGDCRGAGGSRFALGVWTVACGGYRLVGCPPGHQLVNSIGSQFAHDSQTCLPCQVDQYIVDPNRSDFTCHDCPAGAQCNGSSLQGLVNGSRWEKDMATGVFVLLGCPAGYRLQAALQQCDVCPAASYCPGGSSPALSCPPNAFAPEGSGSAQLCQPAVFVTVVMTLPLKPESFPAVVGPFREGLAEAAELDVKLVWVQTVSRRDSAQSLVVHVRSQLAAENANAAATVASRVSSADITRHMANHGLAGGALESVAVAGATTDSVEGFSMLGVILICVIMGVFLIVLGVLGRMVYREVKAKRTGQELAIKLMVPEHGLFNEIERRRLLREAGVLDLMKQRNCDEAVCLVGKDAFQIFHNLAWFVLDLIKGNNLEVVIKDLQGGALGEVECIRVARSVLVALKVMHSEGLVHRDIKPSNIMQSTCEDRTFSYRLIDFGTAVGVDEALAMNSMMTISVRPVAAGTPAYMSPEMFLEPDKASYPTDLWSLGITLFHLACADLPFKASDDMLWRMEIAGNLDEPSPNVLDRLCESRRATFDHNLALVIRKAMEKRTFNRYMSVDEMHEAVHSCLISRGEACYSVFISYRVASEAPLARLLFDELNHSVTPGGHRVTVFWDAHRLVKGQNWKEGFSNGLMHSLCVLPLFSFGSTAPLATLAPSRRAEGWDVAPVGRARLTGDVGDVEDNFLLELIVADALLERRSVKRDADELGLVEAILPVLVGRQEPKGHPAYPRMGSFFAVQAGGGEYPDRPSPATSASAESLMLRGTRLPAQAAVAASSRSVRELVTRLLTLQGCQLWCHPTDLPEAELTKEQRRDLLNHGCAGPAVDLDGVPLTAEQRVACTGGLDERQLRMLKAEIKHRLPDFHEVIDQAYAAHVASGRQHALLRIATLRRSNRMDWLRTRSQVPNDPENQPSSSGAVNKYGGASEVARGGEGTGGAAVAGNLNSCEVNIVYCGQTSQL